MENARLGERIRRGLYLIALALGLIAVVACAAGADQRAERREMRQERRPDRAPQQEALPAGLTRVKVNAAGGQRYYLIYVPRSYRPGTPTPLVMVFHGGGANAEKMAAQTRFSDLAEREGFIVVYPNGSSMRLRGAASWNAESDRGMDRAEKSGVDDVGFVRAALSQIERDYSIDKRRVYATGMSKGGMFAYTLACRMADDFAAIAAFSATMTVARCDPSQPVGILHVHGTNDRTVPLGGGRGDLTLGRSDYPPVSRAIDFWRSRDRCAGQEEMVSAGPETTCRAWRSCARDVTLCLIEGHGHGWPGSAPVKWQRRANVKVSQTFDGTERAWQFFENNPKP